MHFGYMRKTTKGQKVMGAPHHSSFWNMALVALYSEISPTVQILPLWGGKKKKKNKKKIEFINRYRYSYICF